MIVIGNYWIVSDNQNTQARFFVNTLCHPDNGDTMNWMRMVANSYNDFHWVFHLNMFYQQSMA